MKFTAEGIVGKTTEKRLSRADNLDFEADKIILQKSPTADTRSAKEPVSQSTLLNSSAMHIEDVRKAMKIFEQEIASRAALHDWTKIEFIDDFHKQFSHAQETGNWPDGKEWWYKKYHLVERHHLKDRVPKDVDLIDVMEMIADCCAAGMARSGTYRDDDPENIKDILYVAYKNTIKKLLTKIEVVDSQKGS